MAQTQGNVCLCCSNHLLTSKKKKKKNRHEATLYHKYPPWCCKQHMEKKLD